MLSECCISHEKRAGPTKSHGSHARIGWDTFYWLEGNSCAGFMVCSHYLTPRLIQMGCIELCVAVCAAKRRTSIQTPIGFCVNLSVSLSVSVLGSVNAPLRLITPRAYVSKCDVVIWSHWSLDVNCAIEMHWSRLLVTSQSQSQTRGINSLCILYFTVQEWYPLFYYEISILFCVLFGSMRLLCWST